MGSYEELVIFRRIRKATVDQTEKEMIGPAKRESGPQSIGRRCRSSIREDNRDGQGRILTQAKDEGHISDAIFFDFSKAFDGVPHVPLLHKLESYGIQGKILRWIKAFLSDRSFRVRIGSTYSSPAPVSIGVPQGSVLGPLLFLIYVNDLPDVLASPCLLFPDDLKSWSSNASALQMDVDAAKQWSLNWHLPLNDEKCLHVSFGGDSANAFVMHGEKGPEKIMRIDAKKDLGIWVSSNMAFALHHEKSAQKAFAVLRMIRRTFSRITRMDFQIPYGAYVRPLLEYANQVVYSGRTKYITLIERVQRAATRIVAGLKSVDYETRLAMLDLFTLYYRRLRRDLILTYALFEQRYIRKSDSPPFAQLQVRVTLPESVLEFKMKPNSSGRQLFNQLQVRVTLPESVLEFKMKPNSSGRQLFNQVCTTIGLREVWYFGLQYNDSKGLTKWVKLDKKISPVSKSKDARMEFIFRVKFYPEEVSEELIQEVTQRLFYFETVIMGSPPTSEVSECVSLLKRHRASGSDRLPPVLFEDRGESIACLHPSVEGHRSRPLCLVNSTAHLWKVYHNDVRPTSSVTRPLTTLILYHLTVAGETLTRDFPGLQASPATSHRLSIRSQYSLSDEEWETKIAKWHEQHGDMSKQDAIMEYLKVVQDLEMYGVTYFPIKNNKQTPLWLGVDALGLNIYEQDDRLTPKINFPWNEIRKLQYSHTKFSVKPSDPSGQDLSFYCESNASCKLVLALCTGNHELYARRRGPDSIEVQQMKAQAKEAKTARDAEREKLLAERRARELMEERYLKMERAMQEQELAYEISQSALTDYQRKVKELEAQLEEEKRIHQELKDMQNHLEEVNRQLELQSAASYDERARLVAERDTIMAQIEQQRELIQAQEEEKRAIEAQLALGAQNRMNGDERRLSGGEQSAASYDERARLVAERDTIMAQIEQQRELIQAQEEEKRAIEAQLALGAQNRMNGDERRLSGEQELEALDNLRPEAERQAMAVTDIDYAKRLEIMRLELDPARDRNKLQQVDIRYEENISRGMDKYRTLHAIRQGNTKKRVEQFESM
ncbi:hypothetical protein T265_01853 [Opisthorchis viverrini]|uniref:FERM domain-containing protein n=1 Tax=Opisthorchis viverrini TaxID=6198 RepID=A0A074ZYC4_OPIVI|nr:hypothetical protein T265_01853 [Opisthorchis viverrini]KER32081.1 hypothetical protein T265_01853 [Opisthorchis viverrini]